MISILFYLFKVCFMVYLVVHVPCDLECVFYYCQMEFSKEADR